MNSQRVLLIGENGQLGAVLKERFQKHETFFSISRKELDITDIKEISASYLKYKPDIIINATAYTEVDQAEDDQESAFQVNCQGIKNLVDCIPLECKLIHISTDFVFSGNSKVPYKNCDKAQPVNIYGLSKVCGEKRIVNARNSKYLIFRTSWLYSESTKNFVTSILHALKEKSELSVVGDQFGSPTSVYSLADIIERSLCDNNVYGLFHWSDEGEISWFDFAVEIQNQAIKLGLIDNIKPIKEINSRDYKARAKRPKYSVLDCTDTCERFGLKQKYWKDALFYVMKKISLQICN